MYTNIRTALYNLVAAFDSDKRADHLYGEVCEEMSGHELTTLNQCLARMRLDDLLDAFNQRDEQNEVLGKFFSLVHAEI